MIGASGFVGTAVLSALERNGHEAVAARAPRVEASTEDWSEEDHAFFEKQLVGVDAAVNAAGLAEATSIDRQSLIAANALLPGIIAFECSRLNIRLVHVSSAAVQGRRKLLDATSYTEPFSPYSHSKAIGESNVLRHPGCIVYRPPGVHGVNRRITQKLSTLADSPLSTVAGTGKANTPQALIENVADAISHLATHPQQPPPIVSHPSEGLTTDLLLRLLGRKPPRKIPENVARFVVDFAYKASSVNPNLKGHARRLELLWFGQMQAESWLTQAGWIPPFGLSSWSDIGNTINDKRD